MSDIARIAADLKEIAPTRVVRAVRVLGTKSEVIGLISRQKDGDQIVVKEYYDDSGNIVNADLFVKGETSYYEYWLSCYRALLYGKRFKEQRATWYPLA